MPRLIVVDHKRDNAEERLKGRLTAEDNRGLLRFLTCGSVDDGKSTLIGRLLFDTKTILADTLSQITRTSKKRGLDAEDTIQAALNQFHQCADVRQNSTN